MVPAVLQVNGAESGVRHRPERGEIFAPRRTSAYQFALTEGMPYVRDPGSTASRSATSGCAITVTDRNDGVSRARSRSMEPPRYTANSPRVSGRTACWRRSMILTSGTSIITRGNGEVLSRHEHRDAPTTANLSQASGMFARTVAGNSRANTGSGYNRHERGHLQEANVSERNPAQLRGRGRRLYPRVAYDTPHRSGVMNKVLTESWGAPKAVGER